MRAADSWAPVVKEVVTRLQAVKLNELSPGGIPRVVYRSSVENVGRVDAESFSCLFQRMCRA